MQGQKLELAIDSIRLRYGSQALTRAAELPPPLPWASGTPIDNLTGIGGVPRGRLTLFTGTGTCGKLTLALALLAKASHEFAHTIVIVRAGAGFLLLLRDVPEHWLGPLESGASRSGTVVVGVVETPDRALAHASSFSVGFSRQDWVWERGQLVGLRVSARCVKNRVAPPLGGTELEIRYPLGKQSPRDFTPGVVEIPLHHEEALPRVSAAV
jgi:RecA/RadA recombinase